jgi:hypothetical protein
VIRPCGGCVIEDGKFLRGGIGLTTGLGFFCNCISSICLRWLEFLVRWLEVFVGWSRLQLSSRNRDCQPPCELVFLSMSKFLEFSAFATVLSHELGTRLCWRVLTKGNIFLRYDEAV